MEDNFTLSLPVHVCNWVVGNLGYYLLSSSSPSPGAGGAAASRDYFAFCGGSSSSNTHSDLDAAARQLARAASSAAAAMTLLNTSLVLLVLALLLRCWPSFRAFDMRSWLHLHSRKKPTKRRRRRKRNQDPPETPTISPSLYVPSVADLPTRLPVPDDAAAKLHHGDGKTFTNPWPSCVHVSDIVMMVHLFWRQITGTGKYPDTERPRVLVQKPKFDATRTNDALRAHWLGHATCFVEFPRGLRVLFDPIFRERCTLFFSWLGPKRFTKAPCQTEDIPLIDAVVISHNHCDHLDHATIMEIVARHPNCHFFVPLRVKQWFISSKIPADHVTELDWWEDAELTLTLPADAPPVIDSPDAPPAPRTISGRFSCLPCQHTSAQGILDKAYTLWASWSVASNGKSIWFGGDTGYRTVPELPDHVDDYGPDQQHPHCPAFAQIGALRGPFDVGLIPIGAYDPRHMMSPMHANPYDSVHIFRDTQCARAIGIHWGTWVLTEEDVREPPRLLRKALKYIGLPEKGVFDVCAIGGCVEYA